MILPEDKEIQTKRRNKGIGLLEKPKDPLDWLLGDYSDRGVAWHLGHRFLIVHATAEPLNRQPFPPPPSSHTGNLAAPNFTTENEQDGVVREPEVQITLAAETTVEVKDRTDYEIYIVQEGDTIFDIADRYGLAAETILWTNWYVLGEMPDAIYPGNEVIIPQLTALCINGMMATD